MGIIAGISTALEFGWFGGVISGVSTGLVSGFVMALIFTHWPQPKDPSRLKVFYKGDEKPSNSNRDKTDKTN